MTALEVPADLVDRVHKQLYIGGRWVQAADGATFAVENPASGQVLCRVAAASPEDALAALAALAAADAVQQAWAATSPRHRADILRRAYELVIDRTEEIALLITREMGKSVAESRGEVAYAADYLRWFAEEAVRISGDWRINTAGDGRIVTLRQAVGPCLLITPWNAPLALATRKIGPALAAGCTVIVKPAAQTPLNTLWLAGILAEAGLPAGVLNVITTDSAAAVTAPLLNDGRLRKVSFTGSTAVGKQLIKSSAEHVLRTSMELGGNAAFIVCADAGLDAAVDGAMIAKMRNVGEACIAANRFFVHADVAAEFTRRLSERMNALIVGAGEEQGVDVGPLIDATQRQRVADLVEDAVAHGARVVSGGHMPEGAGYFYPPTVLADVPAAARMTQEEIFGPIAPITAYTDEDAMIRAANDTPFGLTGYLYTRDLTRAVRLSEQLQSGMVGVNRGFISDAAAPFGGVKQSGQGREGGLTGIDEYLEVKYLALGLT